MESWTFFMKIGRIVPNWHKKIKDKPAKNWNTQGLSQSIKTRVELYRNWKEDSCNLDLIGKNTSYAYKLDELMHSAKESYDSEIVNQIGENIKRIWSFIKKYILLPVRVIHNNEQVQSKAYK